jgi:predicted nucleic acid-binding protein
MKTVLLDTVGLIALWEETDQWHAPAEQAMLALNVAEVRLVTTSFILLECGNTAARKPYRSDVEILRQRLMADGRIIVPTESDIEQGWSEYRRASAGDAGIID